MFKITAYKFISYILSNYAVDKVLATVKDIYIAIYHNEILNCLRNFTRQ